MKKFAFLTLAAVSIAHADDRIRTEIYDQDRVYAVQTAIGRATLIQFEKDESLVVTPNSVLGLGDANAWNLGVRGNNIVLKPSKELPWTNVIVVTNKRTYSFDLLETKRGTPPTYVLRFRYLDTEAAEARAQAIAEAKQAKAAAAAEAELSKIRINASYTWRGESQLLKPTAAYDDGRFTRLVYDHAGELPVFFKVMPDGSEALLNYNIDPEDKRTVVLHEVIRTVRARLGKEVIEIINDAYQQPEINRNGTTAPGVVRVDKEQS